MLIIILAYGALLMAQWRISHSPCVTVEQCHLLHECSQIESDGNIPEAQLLCYKSLSKDGTTSVIRKIMRLLYSRTLIRIMI